MISSSKIPPIRPPLGRCILDFTEPQGKGKVCGANFACQLEFGAGRPPPLDPNMLGYCMRWPDDRHDICGGRDDPICPVRESCVANWANGCGPDQFYPLGDCQGFCKELAINLDPTT